MMFQRSRERLTYGNVVSSLALFIALSGTAYAVTLPRNSVGSAQIRQGAVNASEVRSRAIRSSEVKDRSLGVRDLSPSARNALRGQTGATGGPGPAGPPGPTGVTYRAEVSSGGIEGRGNALRASTRGMNEYLVAFDRSVDECISTATLAGVDVTPPAGRITVARERGEVLVRTFDAAGNPMKLGFHLIVAC
jgi:hypothetical protein